MHLLNSASKSTSGWFQRQQSKSGNSTNEEKQADKNAEDRNSEAVTNVTQASSGSEPERLATTSDKLSDEDEKKQNEEGDQIETSDEVRKMK